MKTQSKLLIILILTIGLSLPACELLEDLLEDENDEVIDDNNEHTVTDTDGNVYQTVIIGDQEWMAENLRVTKYNNGDPIPTGLSDDDWGDTTEGAYAIFDHNHEDADGINSPEEMVAAYGKLYNWYAATDLRGLCPDGWHVPSDDDWTELVNYVENQGFPNNSSAQLGAGNALKSCRQVDSPYGGDCDTSEHPRWNSHSTHYSFDEFGFSALPGGDRSIYGGFDRIGSGGYWWSSSEGSSSHAGTRGMAHYVGNVNRLYRHKPTGFSLRCVRAID